MYQYRKVDVLGAFGHLIEFKRIPRHYGWCFSNLSLHGVNDGCPLAIEPGKSHDIYVHQATVDNLLKEAESRRLKAVAQDALWRNCYSKALDC